VSGYDDDDPVPGMGTLTYGELARRRPRAYTRLPEPDPRLAERNQEHVRARNRELHPLWSEAVESVVSSRMPLEDAARALYATDRRRSRAGRSRPAR
jgi:hypothetical protein